MKKIPNMGNIWVSVACVATQIVVEKMMEYILEKLK